MALFTKQKTGRNNKVRITIIEMINETSKQVGYIQTKSWAVILSRKLICGLPYIA